MRLAACLALVLLTAGCAAEKARERPLRAQQVIELGQQGQAAFFQGDLARAARLFHRALTDAMRIEDSEGVAIMSINLARVARESGDSAGGLARLDAVSSWHRRNLTAKADQEMELLAAVLLSDLGQPDPALMRLQALRDQCQYVCDMALGLDSLQARLILEKGDAASATRLANAAIERFRNTADRLELANLFRVLGEAHLALGDFQAARQSLENGLSIDKSLGLPGKIALDLEALARTALAAKDTTAHAGYVARLEEVRLTRAGKSTR